MFVWPVIIRVLLLADTSLASWGDQSPHFRQCTGDCSRVNCSSESTSAWQSSQTLAEQVVGWSCEEDCKYHCMWETVRVYGEHGRVPQFYGKWPFIRVLGIQEPASVVASLLNLATNTFMLGWFVKKAPREAPMYWVWVCYGLTAVNAWVWSTVFHSRDKVVTERLDYFSALATVLFSFLAFCLRVVGPKNTRSLIIISLFVAFFSNHVYNMAFVHFDYGYNMKVNVAVGAANCICWLVWFTSHWADGSHVLKGFLAVVLVASSVALELLDFSPIYWTLDSHAIWHFATVPLPLLWFQFALGDTKTQEARLKSE